MLPHLVYYQLVILGLVWLCVMLPHLCRAFPMGCPRGQLIPPSPSATAPVSPNHAQGGRTSPPVRCVSQRAWRALQRLRYGPLPCLQPTGVLVRSIPPGTFVPISIVTMAAGWGSTICGRMAIPVVAHGGSATALAATGTLWKRPARCFMAGRRRWN
jgi:hypothetical protein